MQTEGRTCRGGISYEQQKKQVYMTPEEKFMGCPQSRLREWESGLSARMKNVGMPLKGSSQEWKRRQWDAWHCQIPAGMTRTLTHNWRGLGKRWGDLVTSAILPVPEETKRWTKCQKKSTKRYSEREKIPQMPKNECYLMDEIFWLPFVCPVFRDTKLEHVVLIKKKAQSV